MLNIFVCYLLCIFAMLHNLINPTDERTLLEKYLLPGSGDPSSMRLLISLIMVASVVWTQDTGLSEGLVTDELFFIADELFSILFSFE